jgi:MFS family permease
LFNLVAAALALPAGKLADKVSPAKVYAFGLVIFAAAYATLGLTNNIVIAVIAIGVYGIFPAMTDGVGKAWISKQAPTEIRGKAQGWYQAMMNFAVLGAGIWGGALWISGAVQPVLVIAAVLALAGSAILATRK